MAHLAASGVDHNLLNVINTNISQALSKEFSYETSPDLRPVKVVKRNKDLPKGEFVIAKACFISQPGKVQCELANQIEEDGILNKVQTALDQSCVKGEEWLRFKSIYIDSGNLLIRLERDKIFSQVLSNVERMKNRYGHHTEETESQVLVHVCDTEGATANITLDFIRSVLLAEHVKILLEANSYKVDTTCPGLKHTDFDEVCDLYGISSFSSRRQDSLNENGIYQKMLDACEQSAYRKFDSEAEPEDKIVLDLKKYAIDKGLEIGGEGFEKRLNVAIIQRNDVVLAQTAELEKNLRNLKQDSTNIFHIVPFEQDFHQQKADVVWRIASPLAPFFNQIHLIRGPISTKDKSKSKEDAKAFFSLRKKQMKEASMMKYGEQVQGSGWENTIIAMTQAAIKFEILSKTCRQPVKLDLSDDSSGPIYNKGGVFVMYNCARLATLFTHYEESVTKGIYPQLPGIETVDFSVLDVEEEWELLFNYILPFPNVIHETVKTAMANKKTKSPVHTHKVCQFVQDLSRDFSSYYNRVHILVEPRPKLLPIMFARLYLMKAIQQVFKNGLALLNITPLSQL